MVVHEEKSLGFILQISWHFIHECYTSAWISDALSNCQVNIVLQRATHI